MGKVSHEPTTGLFPVPVVLVSCGTERPNIITLAWVGTVCSDPPMVGIAVRPSRYSHGLIRELGEFVVNLPNSAMVEPLNLCGTRSGRDTDKFALCGLTALPAAEVRAPLIAECPIHLECVVRQRVPLGSHDLFLGQIVAMQSDRAVLNRAGQIDYLRADLLCYLGSGAYHAVGRPVSAG